MFDIRFEKPDFEAIKKEGFMPFDMHVHTRYSLDAISKVSNLCKKAAKLGMGFAVTDHNAIMGAKKAMNDRRKIPVIPGIEVTCAAGTHMLAYFYDYPSLKEFYDRKVVPNLVNPMLTKVTVEQMLQWKHDYNYVVGAPHPFSPGAPALKKRGLEKSKERLLDLIEVLNGYDLHSHNLKALQWANDARRPMTGGSDAHSTYELAKVVTCVPLRDAESVFKDVKKKNATISGREEGFLLKVIMTVEKEGKFLENTVQKHMVVKMFRSQFGSEYRYFKRRFLNRLHPRPLLH